LSKLTDRAAAASRSPTCSPSLNVLAYDGATGALTVTLKDVEDRALWSITLDPASTD
jgi:hypothetical protein